MKHVEVLANKTISTMIRRVWVALETNARFGAKVIRRRYVQQDEFVAVTQKNENQLHIHYYHVTNGVFIATMVNNKITKLYIRKNEVVYNATEAVVVSKPYFDAIMGIMHANSPCGHVKTALRTVGDYLLSRSSSKSGRTKQCLIHGKSDVTAWRTATGKVTVSATGKHEVYLELNGDDLTVSYGEVNNVRKIVVLNSGKVVKYLGEEYVDFDYEPSRNKAVKFLKAVYPEAF